MGFRFRAWSLEFRLEGSEGLWLMGFGVWGLGVMRFRLTGFKGLWGFGLRVVHDTSTFNEIKKGVWGLRTT